MKSLNVPCIPDLAQRSDAALIEALETRGAAFDIDQVCWPDQFPYRPFCGGKLAHDGRSLAMIFHVWGLDLRARNLTDNGRQWEDSTCEFFVADPVDGTYYNFELNCVGRLLGGKGVCRQNRLVRPLTDLAQIRRWSSLPLQEVEENGSLQGWAVAMVIPFTLMGFAPGETPKHLKVNFYKCADMTDHVHYLSWSRVGCPSPDFHRPEYFGELTLD